LDDILKELNKLHDKWVRYAESVYDDYETDGVYHCVNELARLIKKYENREVGGGR